MAYVLVVLAVGMEVLGTSLLPVTKGFTRLGPSLASLGSYAVSIMLLSRIVDRLPVGVVYAMWSGLGTTAVMAIGAVFLSEPLTITKIAGAGLIITGVIVLNLGGAR
jgi:small multidrug resistance pump